MSGARCVVFVQHAVVADAPPPHLAHIVRCKRTAAYEAELRWLKRRYHFVSYEDVHASLDGSRSLPKNAALLTFDDGFAEIYSVVRPLLRAMGLPALVFVTESLLDNRALSSDCKVSLCVNTFLTLDQGQRASLLERAGISDFGTLMSDDAGLRLQRCLLFDGTLTDSLWSHLGLNEKAYLHDMRPYLTSEQVTQMASEGFSFGGHGIVHRRLQVLSLPELEEDILRSCTAVGELTGEPSVPFAFPYTGRGMRRDWLAEIRTRHPLVGLYFDVDGFRREGSLVWHRLYIEWPDESVGTTIRRAYLRAMRNSKGRGSGLLAGAP
jgi:peptidoglycan/xylan/chitin deacetylase (PgdA/CDA1 family)